MISNSMTTKLQQKFAPSQIQFMKLLQMPSSSLEDRIKEELEKNPLLEEEEKKDIPLEVPVVKTDATGRVRNLNIDKKSERFKVDPGSYNAAQDSMYEMLMQQLRFAHITDLQQEIGKEIVGNINDNGYLTRTTDAIADDFFFSHNIEISKQQVEQVLKIIQTFDPAGVGARDLQECLTLQIDRTHIKSEPVELAKQIIKNNSYFEMFKNRHYKLLLNKIGCTPSLLSQAEEVIKKLNPKPSSGSEGLYDTVYIVPDFLVWNNEGKVEFQLTKTFEKSLKLSPYYIKMLDNLKKDATNADNKQAINFIKERMDSANEFMSSLMRRDETLKMVMGAIIKFQYAYFLDGDIDKLKPMRLVDIANMTGNDVSTISRVSRNKYAQTHFGLFQLKQFFSNAVEDTNGNQISSDTIKNIIVSHIEKEDKKHPLTDDNLSEILKQEGYNLARRTVAKYRDSLNIPVARLRRGLS